MTRWRNSSLSFAIAAGTSLLLLVDVTDDPPWYRPPVFLVIVVWLVLTGIRERRRGD